jgi:hypothetical protein
MVGDFFSARLSVLFPMLCPTFGAPPLCETPTGDVGMEDQAPSVLLTDQRVVGIRLRRLTSAVGTPRSFWFHRSLQALTIRPKRSGEQRKMGLGISYLCGLSSS